MKYSQFTIDVFQGDEFATHTITDVGSLHQHAFFEFAYVIRGKVRHITPTTENYYTNNTLLILRPEKDIHSFDERNCDGAYHRDILVSKNLMKEVCTFLNPTIYDNIENADSFITVPLSNEDFIGLENTLNLYTQIRNIDVNISRSLEKSIVTSLMEIYLKKTFDFQSPNKVLVDIINLMHTPNVLQLGITEIVKESGYSHGHLCRIIKQNFNKSLLDLLTEFRMEKAAVLLKTTNITLLDISSIVGYESLSHFISVFKKTFNTSPNKYRKQFICKI